MSNHLKKQKLRLYDKDYKLDHADSDMFIDDNINYQHICPRNPIRTCNCSNKCADDDYEQGRNDG